MIRRKLFIGTAITASVAITACSDITAPKSLVTTGSPPTAILASPSAAAKTGTVVATINGGGRANMDDGMGTSLWGAGVKLFSDGSASGEFDCVDKHGDHPGYPGNVWGQVTSWSIDPVDGSIVLNVIGKFVPIPGGHPSTIPFVVKIQQFGGAGVGHWTLAVPDGSGGWFTVCFETLTSGQIVIRWT